MTDKHTPTGASGQSLDPIERAVEDIAHGKAVIVVDDEDRENEGDLIFAAEMATAELVAFMVRHTSGYICVPLTEADCDRLELPPAHHTNEDQRGTAYRVSVDAVGGGTGISAADRARTIRALANPQTGAADLTRPGHVVPLCAHPLGVLARTGHTEAAVDLAWLAGLTPAGVLCEIVSERHPASMARLDELADFSATHGLSLISIKDLVEYRAKGATPLAREPQKIRSLADYRSSRGT